LCTSKKDTQNNTNTLSFANEGDNFRKIAEEEATTPETEMTQQTSIVSLT
jgi:hypothetical protein